MMPKTTGSPLGRQAKINAMSLLEQLAPSPHAAEFHQIEIPAPPEVVYRSLRTADLGGSTIIKALLVLRSLPAVLLGREKRSVRSAVTLQSIISAGFGLLAEEPGREVVLGITGRFWRPTGNIEPFDRESFSRPVPAGLARGIWNFKVAPSSSGGTILSTETRVTCGDEASRSKFGLYWRVIRPFSGLIRIMMLKAIRREATRPATGGSKAF